MADGSLSHLKLSWASCFGINWGLLHRLRHKWYALPHSPWAWCLVWIGEWLACSDRQVLGTYGWFGPTSFNPYPQLLLSHPQSSLEAVSSHTCRATISVADQHWGVEIRRQSPGASLPIRSLSPGTHSEPCKPSSFTYASCDALNLLWNMLFLRPGAVVLMCGFL